MIKVIFARGLIASGKSTWAKEFVANNQNYKRVSRDDFRHMTNSYIYTDENEKMVTKLWDVTVASLIAQGYNLVIDEQNLNSKYLEDHKSFIKTVCDHENKTVEFLVKDFPITLGEAITRDKQRDFSIGEKIIKKTWHKYELTLRKMLEDSRKTKVYPFDPNLPYCIICDIDGTLSRPNDRGIFDYSKVDNDYVIEQVAFMIKKLKESTNMIIVMMSGREEQAREKTIKWFEQAKIPYDFFYMRKDKDSRADNIVKLELFDNHIRNKFNPFCVFDDRIQVLKMWQDLGIFTFDVRQDAEGKNIF
jgi:predicted kinase